MPATEIGSSADELHYRRAMRRVYVHTVWLSLAGAAAIAWQVSLAWGLGFLLGAAASVLNLRWLHQLVDGIGPGGKKPRKRLGALLSARYLLFGAFAYILIRYFRVNLIGILIGLFVAVAAVLVEMIYELIYARN